MWTHVLLTARWASEFLATGWARNASASRSCVLLLTACLGLILAVILRSSSSAVHATRLQSLTPTPAAPRGWLALVPLPTGILCSLLHALLPYNPGTLGALLLAAAAGYAAGASQHRRPAHRAVDGRSSGHATSAAAGPGAHLNHISISLASRLHAALELLRDLLPGHVVEELLDESQAAPQPQPDIGLDAAGGDLLPTQLPPLRTSSSMATGFGEPWCESGAFAACASEASSLFLVPPGTAAAQCGWLEPSAGGTGAGVGAGSPPHAFFPPWSPSVASAFDSPTGAVAGGDGSEAFLALPVRRRLSYSSRNTSYASCRTGPIERSISTSVDALLWPTDAGGAAGAGGVGGALASAAGAAPGEGPQSCVSSVEGYLQRAATNDGYTCGSDTGGVCAWLTGRSIAGQAVGRPAAGVSDDGRGRRSSGGLAVASPPYLYGNLSTPPPPSAAVAAAAATEFGMGVTTGRARATVPLARCSSGGGAAGCSCGCGWNGTAGVFFGRGARGGRSGGSGSGYVRGSGGGSSSSGAATGSGCGCHCGCDSGCGAASVGTTGTESGTSSGSGFVSAGSCTGCSVSALAALEPSATVAAAAVVKEQTAAAAGASEPAGGGSSRQLCLSGAEPMAWEEERTRVLAAIEGGSSKRLLAVVEAEAAADLMDGIAAEEEAKTEMETEASDIRLCTIGDAIEAHATAAAAAAAAAPREEKQCCSHEEEGAAGMCALRRACSRALAGGGSSIGHACAEAFGSTFHRMDTEADGGDNGAAAVDGKHNHNATFSCNANGYAEGDGDGDVLSSVWLNLPARARRLPWSPGPWGMLGAVDDATATAAAAAAAGVSLAVESPAASRRASIDVRNGRGRSGNSGSGMPTFSGMLALSAAAAVASTPRSGGVSSSTIRSAYSAASIEDADDAGGGGAAAAAATPELGGSNGGGAARRHRSGGSGGGRRSSSLSPSASPQLLTRSLLDRGLMRAMAAASAADSTSGSDGSKAATAAPAAALAAAGAAHEAGTPELQLKRSGTAAAHTAAAAAAAEADDSSDSWVEPEVASPVDEGGDAAPEGSSAAAQIVFGTAAPAVQDGSGGARGSGGGLGFGLRRVKTSIAELFSLAGGGAGGADGAADGRCGGEGGRRSFNCGRTTGDGGAAALMGPATAAAAGGVEPPRRGDAGLGPAAIEHGGCGGNRQLHRRSLSLVNAGGRVGAGAAKLLRAASSAVVGGLLYGSLPSQLPWASPTSLRAPYDQASAPEGGDGGGNGGMSINGKAFSRAVSSSLLPLTDPARAQPSLRAFDGFDNGGGGNFPGVARAPWLVAASRSVPLPMQLWPTPLSPAAGAASPTPLSPFVAAAAGSLRTASLTPDGYGTSPPFASSSTVHELAAASPSPPTAVSGQSWSTPPRSLASPLRPETSPAAVAAAAGAAAPPPPPLLSPRPSLAHRSMSWCNLNVVDGAPDPPDSTAMRAAAAAAAAARAALRRLLPSDPAESPTAGGASRNGGGGGAGVNVQGSDAFGPATQLASSWPAVLQRRPSGIVGPEEMEAALVGQPGESGGGGGSPAAAVGAASRLRRLHRVSTGVNSGGALDGGPSSTDTLAPIGTGGRLAPAAPFAAAPEAGSPVSGGGGGRGASYGRLSAGSLNNSYGGYSLGRDLPYAEWHPSVSVLFADVVGFTRISDRVPAVAVMEMLNALYCRLDALCTRWQAGAGAGLGGQAGPAPGPPVYKVQIIGDAYMVATGLLADDPAHAATACLFALECLREATQVVDPCEGRPLRLRVGIHSGPVVSGVVGRLRRQYSVFGDTVNVASRMESTGAPGAIHVSADTQRLAAPYLQPPYVPYGSIVWRQRTGVEVKGKGVMDTYWLEEAPPAVAAAAPLPAVLPPPPPPAPPAAAAQAPGAATAPETDTCTLPERFQESQLTAPEAAAAPAAVPAPLSRTGPCNS